MALIPWSMAEAAESLSERLAASPRADALAIQILGGRRRSDFGGREPGWQYELALSYGRLWRLGPPSLHQLGFRALLALPDLRGSRSHRSRSTDGERARA